MLGQNDLHCGSAGHGCRPKDAAANVIPVSAGTWPPWKTSNPGSTVEHENFTGHRMRPDEFLFHESFESP